MNQNLNPSVFHYGKPVNPSYTEANVFSAVIVSIEEPKPNIAPMITKTSITTLNGGLKNWQRFKRLMLARLILSCLILAWVVYILAMVL